MQKGVNIRVWKNIISEIERTPGRHQKETGNQQTDNRKTTGLQQTHTIKDTERTSLP